MDFLEVSGGIRLVSDAAVVTSWIGERGSGGGLQPETCVCLCVCSSLCELGAADSVHEER